MKGGGGEVCFVCGASTPLAESLLTSPSSTDAKAPYFPWLKTVHAAPSSSPPNSKTGAVRACLLCQRLLHEQWRLHERRKTPVAARQYWTKSWNFGAGGGVDGAPLGFASAVSPATSDGGGGGGHAAEPGAECSVCAKPSEQCFQLGEQAGGGSRRVCAACLVGRYQSTLEQTLSSLGGTDADVGTMALLYQALLQNFASSEGQQVAAAATDAARETATKGP